MARHEKTSTHEEAGEGEGSCKGRPESGREDGQGLQADTHPGDRVGAVPLPALIAAVLLLAALPGGAAAGDEPVPTLRVVTFNLLHGGPSSAVFRSSRRAWWTCRAAGASTIRACCSARPCRRRAGRWMSSRPTRATTPVRCGALWRWWACGAVPCPSS